MITLLIYALPQANHAWFFQIYLHFRYQKQGYLLILVVRDEQPLKNISLTNSIPVKYVGQFWLQQNQRSSILNICNESWRILEAAPEMEVKTFNRWVLDWKSSERVKQESLTWYHSWHYVHITFCVCSWTLETDYVRAFYDFHFRQYFPFWFLFKTTAV